MQNILAQTKINKFINPFQKSIVVKSNLNEGILVSNKTSIFATVKTNNYVSPNSII